MRTLFSLLLLLIAGSLPAAEPVKAKKIVLIAGPMDGSHPAGTHEYEKTVRLFKHCLDSAANVKNIRTEAHLRGWPDRPATLDDADTIVFVSSGSDRNAKDHPLLVGDRMATLKKHMDRGCGLVLVHWSTFLPNDSAGDSILDWVGGHFDYQSGPAKNGWYSKIQTVMAKATPGEHPTTRGIKPFEILDEFYYNIKFRPKEPKATPILNVEIGKEGLQTVGWALERANGGRGVGFTGGHFFDNWRNDSYRKLLLNSILWTAHAEVPEDGVRSEFIGDREINLVTVGSPAQALILTGHDGPFHNWRETSQMLKTIIERDGRFRCRIIDDVEFLAREDLSGYELIVQNYVNWQRPGLSDAAKKNLLKYLESGHGLAVIHFANGAFHSSLPDAKESDWPEYRKIVRRVWDHTKGKSGHDSYGKFPVKIVGKHPITEGMTDFETTDELYYRQQGDEPVEVLATAKSRDTGKDEPLAWVYQYGKARVFQTVLGHSAESLRGEGPALLIRRACAWAANREIPVIKTPTPVVRQLQFGEGKFDKALDARAIPASIEGDDRYRKPPFSVECWAKLFSKTNFNVLASSDPKSSARHWEIYTFSGTGVLSVFMPGMQASAIQSSVNICDGAWHHVAMTFDGTTVRLWADGKMVTEQKVTANKSLANVDGPLLIGGAYAPDHRVGSDGLVDDVRISKIIREFKAVPAAALERDEHTISLWKLDGNEGISADTNWTPPASVAGEAWERETDKDWVDGRFQKTDTGPFQNATIDYTGPVGKGRVYKATAIKLGDKQETSYLFDRNQLRFAATWSGGFLNHSSRRFGLLNTPTPAGTVTFGTSSTLAGWADDKGNFATVHPTTAPIPKEWAKFKGLSLDGQHTSLHYTVGKTTVTETPWAETITKGTAVIRTLLLEPHQEALKCLVAEFPGGKLINIPSGIAVVSLDGTQARMITLHGEATLEIDAKGIVSAALPPTAKRQGVEVVYWTGSAEQQGDFLRAVKSRPAVKTEVETKEKTLPPPRRWTKEITTQLEFGKDADAPLVIDTFALPYQNPYNSLFFVTGVDFLPDGSVAICTAHGDVWIASGDFSKPGPIHWTRYATGLYQPLGLKVVEGTIHVLERGQLTALTGMGEASFYRCVNNDWHTGGGEHSYDTCLETDPDGNFYFFKTGDDHTPTGGCLLKVSKDGSMMEIFSTGFRHPIGLGMSPTGVVSGADQEGNWMPVTRLDLYKKGGFYGDMRTHHRVEPPKTYDPPLLWLPKIADNSAGGQAWIPDEKWGSLGGSMLHLSYGRCKGYAILRDGTKFQAAAADLGLKFLSGSARARFNLKDNGLYVVGLDGWQTAAEKDGCLQRVRATGKPFNMPVGFATSENKIELKFDREIDPASLIGDKGFVVERWNYRWSATYGSKDWSLVDPNKEGHDLVGIKGKTLSEDRRTVTITLSDLAPCMQLRIVYKLTGPGGKPIEGTVYSTIQEKP
ncbi:ThuA domain-containing protein [Zavarzinella formosa]|uniref:ThuA domain-containing protein n=1 Tax=Zavarzinella formosa TaxID=360055 RepID=UPI00138AF2CB|nr:ThuA domain-containing protein [Zavarzinella formosa]